MKTNPTIFIADDDEEDISMLRDSLTDRNSMVSCTTFHNGLVLLNYLKTNVDALPDLIVLDINMPVKNGFLTLHELKLDPQLQDIPVIMLTSTTRKEDEARCLQMGCKTFLKKPDSLSEYITLAERLLLFC